MPKITLLKCHQGCKIPPVVNWVLFVVVFLAVLTQSVSGFGIALVSMAILPAILGIKIATPLVALVALTLEALLILRFRSHLNFKEILPLVAASIAGIPMGLLLIRYVDERLVLGLLGIIIAGYSSYSLMKIQMPELRNPLWSIGSGFIAGMLGAAYNTSGPPVILYGYSRRWLPAEFKGNLQGFFILNSMLVTAGHFISNNVTAAVWKGYLVAIPALGLGLLAGISLDKRINPESFRKIVLGLLVVMGLRLLIMAFT